VIAKYATNLREGTPSYLVYRWLCEHERRECLDCLPSSTRGSPWVPAVTASSNSTVGIDDRKSDPETDQLFDLLIERHSSSTLFK